MHILRCRRSTIAVLAIICLTALGIYHGQDISGIAMAIAGVAGSLAGSNAWENRARHSGSEKASKKPLPKADSPD